MLGLGLEGWGRGAADPTGCKCHQQQTLHTQINQRRSGDLIRGVLSKEKSRILMKEGLISSFSSCTSHQGAGITLMEFEVS